MQIQKPKQGYKLVNWYFKKKLEIPEDWEIISLEKLSKDGTQNGHAISVNDYGKGTPIVGMTDLFANDILDPSNLKEVKISEKKTELFSLKSNDLIFARRSLNVEGSGRCVIIPTINRPIIFESSVIRMTVNDDVNPKYVYYLLNSHMGKRIMRRIVQVVAVSGITGSDLKKIEIQIPKKLQEQQKIASILSNVDSLIQQTQKEIEQTQRLKKVSMQKLLIKGIGHTKFKKVSWIFGKQLEIPDSWILVTVDKLIKNLNDVKTGPFGSSLKKEIFVSKGYKIYGQENVIPDDFTIGDYYISEEYFKKMEMYEIKPNDILISLVGTHGKISLVPENIEPGIINPRLLKIRFDNSKVMPEYMKILLESKIIEIQIVKFVHGLTMGILNTTILRKILFPIPEILEQQKITQIISNVNSQIQKQQKYKSTLENLKKGLMQKVLTGQIRVKV